MADSAISDELLAMAREILEDGTLSAEKTRPFQQSLKDLGFQITVDGIEGNESRGAAIGLLLGDEYGFNAAGLNHKLLETLANPKTAKDPEIESYVRTLFNEIKAHNETAPTEKQLDATDKLISANQIFSESSFDPKAVGDDGASKGLGQFQGSMATKYGLDGEKDLFDPVKALRAHVAFKGDLKAQGSDRILALVEYNGGPDAVKFGLELLNQENEKQGNPAQDSITGAEWMRVMADRNNARLESKPLSQWSDAELNAWDEKTRKYVEDIMPGRKTEQQEKQAENILNPDKKIEEEGAKMADDSKNDINFKLVFNPDGYFDATHTGTTEQAQTYMTEHDAELKQQMNAMIKEQAGGENATKENFSKKRAEIAAKGFEEHHKASSDTSKNSYGYGSLKHQYGPVQEALYSLAKNIPFEIEPTAPAAIASQEPTETGVKAVTPSEDTKVTYTGEKYGAGFPEHDTPEEDFLFFNEPAAIDPIQEFLASRNPAIKVDSMFGVETGRELKVTLQALAAEALESGVVETEALTQMRDHGIYSGKALASIAGAGGGKYGTNQAFLDFAVPLEKLNSETIDGQSKLDTIYHPELYTGTDTQEAAPDVLQEESNFVQPEAIPLDEDHLKNMKQDGFTPFVAGQSNLDHDFAGDTSGGADNTSQTGKDGSDPENSGDNLASAFSGATNFEKPDSTGQTDTQGPGVEKETVFPPAEEETSEAQNNENVKEAAPVTQTSSMTAEQASAAIIHFMGEGIEKTDSANNIYNETSWTFGAMAEKIAGYGSAEDVERAGKILSSMGYAEDKNILFSGETAVDLLNPDDMRNSVLGQKAFNEGRNSVSPEEITAADELLTASRTHIEEKTHIGALRPEEASGKNIEEHGVKESPKSMTGDFEKSTKPEVAPVQEKEDLKKQESPDNTGEVQTVGKPNQSNLGKLV